MRTKPRKSFRKELKRQLKYAIGAGVGLMIVYAWREALWSSANEIVREFVDTTKIALTNISTSILITVIGVLIILLSSRMLKD